MKMALRMEMPDDFFEFYEFCKSLGASHVHGKVVNLFLHIGLVHFFDGLLICRVYIKYRKSANLQTEVKCIMTCNHLLIDSLAKAVVSVI